MNDYPAYMSVLHDERDPVGTLGQGTHYSVFRTLSWHDPGLRPLPQAFVQDFAVIWDVDHDTRIAEVLETLHRRGLLAPILFIGEHKGGLFVVVSSEAADALGPDGLADYRLLLDNLGRLSGGDVWPLMDLAILGVTGSGIVYDRADRVELYLRCLSMLWRLGVKESPQRNDAGGAG